MVLPSLGGVNATIGTASASGARIAEATEVFKPLLSKLAKFNDIVERFSKVLLSSELSAVANDLRRL
jgi:hypothetical protein